MTINGWLSPVRTTYNTVRTGYEGYRSKFVQKVDERYGSRSGALAQKVSCSISEILIDLCALTGVLVIPASIFFADIWHQ